MQHEFRNSSRVILYYGQTNKEACTVFPGMQEIEANKEYTTTIDEFEAKLSKELLLWHSNGSREQLVPGVSGNCNCTVQEGNGWVCVTATLEDLVYATASVEGRNCIRESANK